MNGQTTFSFGSTAPTFGTAATTSQAGTLFGAASNNTSAGTLFGANTSNSSPAGVLFGGPAKSTGLEGFSKPANAFGAATSQPATTTATTTGFGGGFGTTTTGFGAPATSTATVGGFGATATTGFGGFGQQVQATTGFGQKPQTSTGFGQQATTGFGQQPTTGFGQQPTTGFGQTTTSTGFGGFGTNSGFGATNNLLGNNQQQQQQQQMGVAPVQEKVWQDLALIRAHFDPTSPLCQFRHYFYNMVPTNEAHLYVRPQNQDEQLWNEAVRKNPDPTCLVPVLAVGFDDILKRMEIQSKQVELHQETLKETAERLATVQRQYVLGTLVRLEEHKRRHAHLAGRLLRLLQYSQVLRYKGFPLGTDEEQAMKQLNDLLNQPIQPAQLNEKMTGLWNQLQSIKAQRNNQKEQPEVWRTVRDEDAISIAKVLEDEQKAITHVANILKSDAKELEVIEVGLKDSGRRMN